MERESRPRSDRWFTAMLAVTLPAIAFLALYALDRQLWMDDTHSTYHAWAGPGGVLESLRTDSHPPLYFLFLSYWMELGGIGEIWLRLPSLLMTLAAGLVLYRYGVATGDRRAGWLFALFFLANPIAVTHMHTVRPYALSGLLAAVSTILYLRIADEESRLSRGEWIGYVVVNAAGCLTHYWFFLLLAAQGVGTLLLSRGSDLRSRIFALAASAVPFALLWTPTFLAQTRGAPTSWMGAPGGFWFVSIPAELLGGSRPFDFRPWARGYLAVVLAACFVRFTPRPRPVRGDELGGLLRHRRLWLAAVLPVVVMLLALFVSQLRPIYLAKYTIVVTPAVAVALGLIVLRGVDRRLAPVLCALFVLGHVALRKPTLRYELRRDNGAVVERLLERAEPADEVVHITLAYAPTLHYVRALAPGRTLSSSVFPADVANHVGWRDPEALLSDVPALRAEAAELVDDLAARAERVWLLADLTQDEALTEIVADELERRFDLVDAEAAPGWWVDEIRLYVRAP